MIFSNSVMVDFILPSYNHTENLKSLINSFQYLKKNPLPKAEINKNLESKTPFVFKLVKTCVMMNKRAKGIFGVFFS